MGGGEPMTGGVSLGLEIGVLVPKSFTKKRRDLITTRKTLAYLQLPGSQRNRRNRLGQCVIVDRYVRIG